jgi:tape measure domain-containing protein
MSDRLVIQIDGDASGLTRALKDAHSKLTSFNTNIAAGNKALTSFIGKMNQGAGAITRLTTSVNTLKSSITGLRNTVNTTGNAIDRLGKQARGSAGDLRAFSTALNASGARLKAMGTSASGAGASLTSLNRRAAALSTTISTLNTQLRGLVRSTAAATGGLGAAAGAATRAAGANNAAAGSAGRATGAFHRLNRASISMAESFRRHVAQITALRTLTYQGLFWFSPLIYSIIKTNAAYEKQMQLLKNLSGQTTEIAKQQWALETRKQLVELANTNPFSLDKITQTFVRMKVSGLDPLNGGLQTLMDSIAAFGGSDEQLDRAAIALQQMVGKSAVSMEELRQQIGEHIPDAMASMARGMGLSMADFYDEVKKGTVEARSAIAKMLAVLNDEHRGAALSMMKTWSGLLARLGTAWQNFVANMEHRPGKTSFIETLKNQIQGLMVFLNSPAGVNFAIGVENSMKAVVNMFVKAIKIAYEWRTEIVTAAKIFAVMWGGKLVIGTLLSVMRVFGMALKGIIALMNVFIGRAGAAALVTGRFSTAMRSLAVSLGIAKSASAAAAMGIGAIALRMAGAIGIALALAGAIWGVVRALNAQSAAQKNKALLDHAEQGGAWSEAGEAKKERARLLADKKKVDDGGYWVGGNAGDRGAAFIKYTPQQLAQKRRELAIGVKGFNMKNANTIAATRVAVSQHYTDMYSREDPYAATRAKYNKLMADGNVSQDGKKGLELEKQKNAALAQDAQRDITRLTNARKNAKNPAEQAALDALIEQRIGDRDSYLQGGEALNAPNVSIDAGGDDKKGGKKKGAGEKRDPLEGSRRRFENEFVQTQELWNQYTNLVNNEDVPFDSEAAQAEAEKISAQQKDEESLKKLMRAEQDNQREIKKSIKVQEAIIALRDEYAETNAKTAEGFEDLSLGYESVSLQSKHYKESLEREYRAELAIIESRIKSGSATEDQIRQYKELKNAIDDAVRAKEAELLLEVAREAKERNDEYDASWRSPRQQEQYEADLEYKKYEDALNTAKRIIDRTATTQAVNDAIVALEEAEARLKKAQEEGDNKAVEAIGAEIVVLGQRKQQAQTEADQLAAQAIPYLERRLQILKEEQAMRDKWGGMAGPMIDWAKSAKADFDDLGRTMGGVLTGAMDNFITSLAEGKFAFKDFVKTILKQLLMIIIRGLIAKAILSALGFSGGGGGGGTDWTTMGEFDLGATAGSGWGGDAFGGGHGGMIAGGTARFYRSIDPATFAFAQRYHTGGIIGLRDNEVPIIAEKGEGVFTEEQMKALGGMNKGSNVQVNVVNQTGVQAEVERQPPKFDGEKWVENIILKKMSTAGPIRDALSTMVKR